MRPILTQTVGRIHGGIRWYSGELPNYVEVDIFQCCFDCLDYCRSLFLRGTSHCVEGIEGGRIIAITPN
jgi:hypothetical protein